MNLAPAEVVVRRCGPADAALLADLRRRWVEEQAGGPVEDEGYAAAFAAWFERERDRRVTWTVSVDGRAVGMLNLALFDRMPAPGRLESRWGYVANVFVLAEHREHGLGERLVDTAVQYAREHRCARLVLAPSARSVTLYRRAGFRPATELLVLPLRP